MANRLTRERKTVKVMISMYCQGRHGSGEGQLCAECRALREYAEARVERCPFGPEKPTCSRCPIHCYAYLICLDR
jgi:Nitrous oxide-stimulated promoter